MNNSEQLNELFAAFSLFQGELSNASKSKAGHNYKYADLAACISECKPILSKNGLAVTQLLGGEQDGHQTLTTMLTHSSGQYISQCCVLPKAVLSGGGGKNPVQCLGSSITYMRRYTYAAITGLTQEDEDAKNLVAPPKADSAEMIEIKKQVKAGNSEFVKANWGESIKREWQNFTDTQINTLNQLFSK